MADVDVFVLPDDWKFYQCELGFGASHVTVAGEPHGSCATPVVTVDIQTKVESATIFLDAQEATELWTALGHAIRTSSGAEPKPAELIESK